MPTPKLEKTMRQPKQLLTRTDITSVDSYGILELVNSVIRDYNTIIAITPPSELFTLEQVSHYTLAETTNVINEHITEENLWREHVTDLTATVETQKILIDELNDLLKKPQPPADLFFKQYLQTKMDDLSTDQYIADTILKYINTAIADYEDEIHAQIKDIVHDTIKDVVQEEIDNLRIEVRN